MPVRRTLELTGAQRAQLEEHRDHDPRPWVRERCAALLKIADGLAPHAVARHGLRKPRDPDTVYDWLNWYEREGFWTVEHFQHGGAHRGTPTAQRVEFHTPPEVLAAVAALPQVEPVWLPTYAPWLNPIEKLWRWLRASVLTLHRLTADWDALHARVCAFRAQFAAGSDDLLHYVGLFGDGTLAAAPRAA